MTTKLHVRKGDIVRVLAGKDKDKQGRIIRCIPSSEHVVVEGVNMIKKAIRPTQQNPQGGISTMEAPLHVSNVVLVCPHCSAPTRTAHRFDEDGTKVRVCKKCGRDI